MPLLLNTLEAVSGASISLGVGASTFAIIFFFMAMHSDAACEAARPFQKVVYIVLRVAMGLILAAELAKAVLYLYLGVPLSALLSIDAFVFLWTLVAVLYANAVLMTVHLMPIRLGPAIQATSWYTLGVLVSLPLVTMPYLSLLLIYLACMILVGAGIELMRRRITRRAQKGA